MASKTFAWTSLRKMRRLPPPISTPFHTMSYACARAVRRSAMSAGLGAVKGWCSASRRSSSALYSNIGKSVTHSRAFTPSGTISRERATYCRTRSRVLLTSPTSPAAKSSKSSGSAPMVAISSAVCSAFKPCTRAFAPSSAAPSELTRAKARPLDPAATASLAISPLGLTRPFEIRFPLGTRIALTTPPASTAPLKTIKPQSFTTSDTVTNSNPYRVSGLSQPYRSMASA
mmetsp:Transcript_25284/g.54992  ORF Transcript_25284/g.54992 Transcript_25284/m.54992 type:complete len:230 (+) Transcript_25284:472-1161(+)